MGALIDTSVFVAAERGHLELARVSSGRVGEWFGMAAITASELLAGVAWPGRSESQRQASGLFVEGLLAAVPVAFDLGTLLVLAVSLFRRRRRTRS